VVEEYALQQLRASLVRRRPRSTPSGEQAFEEHQILAMAVHRAVKLIQDEKGGEREGQAWVRYVSAFFPSGRNEDKDAKLLWTDWRTQLVKYETPGAVAVSHGQPEAHWSRDANGILFLNLESLWDDFEHSVDGLIASLRHDKELYAKVLSKWRERAVVVRPFYSGEAVSTASVSVATASFSSGAVLGIGTAFEPPKT
jgi:hypothetical protein